MRRNKPSLVGYAWVAVLTILLIYLLASFINGNFNPMVWGYNENPEKDVSFFARFLFVFVCAFLTSMAICLYNDID